MSVKLIIFATLGEAARTVEKLKARPSPSIPTCYFFDKGLIVIANVGIHSAQMAVSKYINQVDEVWNIGLAGALKNELPIGTLVEIAKVGKHTHLPQNLDAGSIKIVESTIPSFSLPNLGAKLISTDFPIHDRDTREALSSEWDLVDMEGYGVAFAAVGFNKPYRLWKIVSDFASPGGRELIRNNKDKLSLSIAKFLLSQI